MWAKVTIQTQRAELSLQHGIKSTGWAMTAVRSSLIPYAVLLMPLKAEKCIFMVLQHWQKAVYESRSTWFIWVVHESNFHAWTKVDFS